MTEETKITLTEFLDFLVKEGYCDADVYAEPPGEGMTVIDEFLRKRQEGKCPKDGRANRPIYITINNKRTLAVADGKGHAYKVYGEGLDVYNSICKPENKYNSCDYEFERGLSGMDF